MHIPQISHTDTPIPTFQKMHFWRIYIHIHAHVHNINTDTQPDKCAAPRISFFVFLISFLFQRTMFFFFVYIHTYTTSTHRYAARQMRHSPDFNKYIKLMRLRNATAHKELLMTWGWRMHGKWAPDRRLASMHFEKMGYKSKYPPGVLLWMRVCMHCVYICMYRLKAHAHAIFVHTFVPQHVCFCARVSRCMSLWFGARVSRCMSLYFSARVSRCMSLCLCALWCMHACMYVCMHACMCVSTYLCACIYGTSLMMSHVVPTQTQILQIHR